ncbi:MAG: multicopper oxidase family protein [Chloroflexota bacterium]
MKVSRRALLKLGVLGGAAVVLPVAPTVASFGKDQPAPSPRVPQFALPLAIPPVIRPARSTATTDFYEVTQREARVEIIPGLKTTIWGYNGMFPGPTFRVRRGREIVVKQTNLLPDGVVVHQHGGVTPPDSDGYPTDLIPPGGSREYVYPNGHRAATMWYHDHAMGTTGFHNYLGLAGFYIVDDEADDRLPLPRGRYDVPLLIQDRRFAADGSLVFDPLGHIGVIDGDVLLVNGVPWPRFEVANRKYRFRILNGSNSTIFKLRLSSGQPLTQIATGGGLLPAPVESPAIPLAMAERVEVVIDFSRYPIGSQVTLQNLDGDGRLGQIMRFDVAREEPDDSAVPTTLRPIEQIPAVAAAHTREWVFGPRVTLSAVPPVEWVINGREFDPNRIDATPRLGEVEIWQIKNATALKIGGMDHPVHIHLVSFQILDRNGIKPAPYETGWKDTILVPKGEEARVIARFEGYRGKYIMHCHNLEHEDAAMMTNFEVV